MTNKTDQPTRCECGALIGDDDGPPDGWQLEDGRTVCHACCAEDLKKLAALPIAKKRKGAGDE